MNGGDLIALKSMMGHKTLNSTTIYLHMSQDFNNLKGIKVENKNINFAHDKNRQ